MREIKFRVRDESAKKMIYVGDYLNETRKGFPLINFNGDIIAAYPTTEDKNICNLIWARIGYNLELMQYIDLKDNKGTAAYHKDIVRMAIFLYIIEWDERLAKFYLKPINELDNKKYSMSHLKKHGEIIGNVLENPELLHEK